MNEQSRATCKLWFYFWALMFLIPSVSVAAQTRTERRRPPASHPTPAQRQAIESADISITATVTARELMFETAPNSKVEFTGTFARDTVWEAERDNLPRPVEPGVIYRNIAVRLVITSVFPDADRVASEALTETPSRQRVSPPKRPEPPQRPQPIAPRPQRQKPAGRTQQ